MEEIVINRDSWHYKIVEIVNDSPNDICAYRTAFMKASFLILIGVILAFGLLSTLTHAVIGFAFALFYGFEILGELATAGLIIIVIALLFSVAVAFAVWRSEVKEARGHQKPSVVTQAYRSWKEKHCVPVVIK